MRYGKFFATFVALAFVAAAGRAGVAESAVLAEFTGPHPDEILVSGFRLDTDQTLKVTSAGFGYRSGGTKLVLSNAWILDAGTRDVVWEMADAREEWKTKSVTTETYDVDVPAGTYEFYYSTYPHYRERKWGGDISFNLWGRGVDKVLEGVLDEDGYDDVGDLYREFLVRVDGRGTAVGTDEVRAEQDKLAAEAIVSIRKVGDHDYVEKGFELDRKMEIHVYAIGEVRKDGAYDYSWIINADTGERVWQFTYDDSSPAGGADKNRVVDSVFEAPAGRYVAVCGTDDSHSYDRWNSAPPFDPSFWGITIRAGDAAEARYARAFDYKREALKNVIVELTRVGDDEYASRGFTLKKPIEVHVYALGEGRDGHMYDYGWIVDATTRERVWEMNYGETEHAGGGEKNRVFDGTLKLDKGSYVVYYATDDSHAYPNWNTAPPMDRERWGITVTGADGFNQGDVAEYVDKEAGTFLVRMTEMGDGEYRHETFTLDKESTVLVYALGEGMGGRMYDYGWIEDAKTGRVVWEMTYRKTRHAGGAEKNRMFSDTIVLGPGTYKVFYESDDSHSFGDWNSDRPYEPENWGISVRAVDNS